MARLMPTTTAANPIPRMRVALVEETGNVQGVRISRSLASLIFRVRNRVVGSVNLLSFASNVDIITKVPFWPGHARPGQAKMELLF